MKHNMHFITSMIKSTLRILGFMICIFNFQVGVLVLIAAEGFGIIELIEQLFEVQ